MRTGICEWSNTHKMHLASGNIYSALLTYYSENLFPGESNVCLQTKLLVKATIQSYNWSLFGCCKELLLCTPFCGFLSFLFIDSEERRTLNHKKKERECE